MTSTTSHVSASLRAGAASGDLTPRESVFLFGYPHVARWSTGVHDRLECSALYLAAGDDAALFLAHDLIFVPRELVAEARRRIAARTGLRETAMMFTATHTHSGPITVEFLSNAADPVVPKPDAGYLRRLCDVIVDTASRAVAAAAPAEVGFALAQADGTGTNRHDPRGAADPEVPVLVARAVQSGEPIACMLVHAMHPTVLHEDSTLVSGDFPHFTRQYLRERLRAECPVLFHQGASGNQSPRHVTRGNTFAEARRIGERLGGAVDAAIARMSFATNARVRAAATTLPLTVRSFPPADAADRRLAEVRARWTELQRSGAAGPVVRTAECDVFGAEEAAELARAAVDGRLSSTVATRTPAEIQVISVGPWNFVGWPGEFFVEYALEVRRQVPNTFLITLANGELQGYIVTPEAAAQGGYEASNALFDAANGPRFVDATIELIRADARRAKPAS